MNKKRIAIVAPTGMLGSMIYNHLKEKYTLILLYRNKNHITILNKNYGRVKDHISVEFDLQTIYKEFVNSRFKIEVIASLIGEIDYIINCAGIIKPYAIDKPEFTFFINSAFPHVLSNLYHEKLIQITTDCVYTGLEGAPYNEKSKHSANDLYGLSKSLGEPFKKSLVLRTSIIGPEIHGFVSLISWLQKQKDNVSGYTNHYWNGITTRQFAKICNEIISNRQKYPKSGLFHIFSTDVTKYQILQRLKEKYHLPITVIPKEAEKVDRRLRTIYDVNKNLQIPNFEEMIREL